MFDSVWYDDEKALLQQLGVALPPLGKVWEEVSFTVTECLDNKNEGPPWQVEITLTPAPAHFWEFQVRNTVGNTYRFTTGSGSLCDYWPFVLQVATNMIVPRSLEDNDETH